MLVGQKLWTFFCGRGELERPLHVAKVFINKLDYDHKLVTYAEADQEIFNRGGC